MIKHNQYKKCFQGLRGFAILMIFLSHSNFGNNDYGIYYTTWMGNLGVSLFVILSGFLLLENHHGQMLPSKVYYVNKIKKFYPAHLFTLLLALPLSIGTIFPLDLLKLKALGANLLLLQSWIPDKDIYFSFNSVSWYLSMTMFFVLISPIVLKIWNNTNSGRGIIIIISLLVLDFLLCIVFSHYWLNNCRWLLYIFPLFRSIEYIIAGGVMIIITNRKMEPFIYDLGTLFGMILILGALCYSINTSSPWLLSSTWVVPCIMVVGAVSKETKVSRIIFANKPIVFLGNISFEFFLIHLLCIRYLTIIYGKLSVFTTGGLSIFFNFAVSVFLAYMWHCVRKRFKGVKDNSNEQGKAFH